MTRLAAIVFALGILAGACTYQLRPACICDDQQCTRWRCWKESPCPTMVDEAGWCIED